MMPVVGRDSALVEKKRILLRKRGGVFGPNVDALCKVPIGDLVRSSGLDGGGVLEDFVYAAIAAILGGRRGDLDEERENVIRNNVLTRACGAD